MTYIKTITDEDLTALLKKDSKVAFTEIYRRYADSLTGFAMSKLHDMDEARDLLHDFFVKFWEDRQSLNVQENLKSYLFSSIRYKIVDRIRRNISRRSYDSLIQSLADTYEPSVELQIEAEELSLAFVRLIDNLSPRVGLIYKLSRHQNLTVSEIAAMLNLSQQTVKNQLTSALKYLRQSIKYISLLLLLLPSHFWLK
jgi:RNA polymerase sigma-70 factor (family 1)